MKVILLIYMLGYFVSHSKGTITLTVPKAGNCGDDTVLTCHVTGSVGFTGWHGLNRSLVQNGAVVRPEDSNKFTETRGSTSFTLTIHNTDINDWGEYRCQNGFDQSQPVHLNLECKASSAVVSVTDEKKVIITVDKLYPSSPTFSTSFKTGNTGVTLPGSRTCSSSTQYPGYYRCMWSSSHSLPDGSYTYSIVVTTLTQSDPLTGSFKLVPPQPPIISNAIESNDYRLVVYGNEGQPLTIQCKSTGGYPTPTLVWYKDSVSSSNQMASTSTGTLQSDCTYTVTLQHTFTPTLADDKKTVICRSYYPHADSAYRGSEITKELLYLRLKPSNPIVTQVTDVTAGGTVEVRCTTRGSRPAANISWSYQGSTYTGTVTSALDTLTETYTVVSVYRRMVTASDNGRNIQCVVTHQLLVSPPEKIASVSLNVQFSVQASSTSVTGNREMTATGTATLTLTCTTGSSNPAPDITWKNGSVTITNNHPYTETTGENNGVVRSQQLVLTPTRYMDGDVITCSVSNPVSQSPVIDAATLRLKYEPCLPNPCVNGTCFSHGSQFLCQCSQGSTGKLCEKTVDPCEPNPCVYGTCFSHDSLFLCQCSPGYTGKTCQEYDDPCRNKPCVHGSCFSRGTSFICQCPTGYTGKLCEKTDVHNPSVFG